MTSFIGSIKSFIKESAQKVSKKLGITNSAAPQKTPKTAVIEGKKKAPVDEVKLGNSDPNKVNKSNVKALKITIDDACARNGIDSKELYKTMLSMIGLKSMKEFYEKIPQEQQAMYLGFIGATIERAEKQAAKSNTHVDITKIVIVDAKLTLDALQKKALSASDIKEVSKDKSLNNTSKTLLENINSLSEEEMDSAIAELESDIKAYFDFEMKKINEIKDSQKKAAAIKRLRAKIEFKRNQIYNEVLMGADNEHAVGAITVVDSKNLPNAAKNLFATRRNAHERQAAANLFTFNRVQNKIVKTYYDRGDELSTDAYKVFTTEVISHMSTEAANAYRNDYVTARQEYEKTGYPEYMKKDMFSETAAAIVSGTEQNEFMSGEEKTSAIKDFYSQEEQFNDLSEVKQKAGDAKSDKSGSHEIDTVQEDRYKNLQSKIEKAIFDKSEKASVKRAKNETVSNPIEENKKDDPYNYSAAPSKAKVEFVLSSAAFKPEDVAQALKISETKVYKIIFSKASLIEKYEQDAKNYITRQNKISDLVDLARSPKAIKLILNHARVDNKQELSRKLEKKATSFQEYLFKDKEEVNAAD